MSWKLQLIQDVAACLLTDANRLELITRLQELQWFLVPFHAQFKMLFNISIEPYTVWDQST